MKKNKILIENQDVLHELKNSHFVSKHKHGTSLEYKIAYEYLIEYVDRLSKEEQEQIDNDLNEIFHLNKEG